MRDGRLVYERGTGRFNPRLPGGRRPGNCNEHIRLLTRFNPRLPGGRRPPTPAEPRTMIRFQSTPSGGKATHRSGRDPCGDWGFNPRLPGGRRQWLSILNAGEDRFQSTPSGGKATVLSVIRSGARLVSIHAFRGEGDQRRRPQHLRPKRVSIHAFRGEGDRSGGRSALANLMFQSTPSGGKATALPSSRSRPRAVSIHAFRGEGDGMQRRRRRAREVSIHAFRGEGDAAERRDRRAKTFQSTPSGGKATYRCWGKSRIN